MFHFSFQRAAALQRASTKEVFVPVIEMDQNLIYTAYQSAINLKEMVKLTVSQPKEKKTEGIVSLRELAFYDLFLYAFELN